MLNRIVLENYRSCLRTTIDLHPKLSVLIGPNGSGKTNILQGIMLLNQIAHGEEPNAGRGRLTTTSRVKARFRVDGVNAILNSSVVSYVDESNHDTVLRSTQKWQFKKGGRRPRSFTSGLPLAFSGDPGFLHLPLNVQANLIRHRFLPFSRHLQRMPDIRMLEEATAKWVGPPLSAISRYCLGIRYYGASQFTNPGTCPTSFEIEREGEHRNLHRLRGHARILYAMYSASRNPKKTKYDQFKEIVGPKGLRLIDNITFREVKSSSTEYSVRVGGKVERRRRDNLLVVPQFKIGAQTLSPNQLSEGTFKTLALLLHLITENSMALLVEEPEVCIHHGLLASILELVKSYSNEKQIIISTHSDYVLDHVDPENVFRVTHSAEEGTLSRPIKRTLNAKEYQALRQYLEREGNLGEYWREGGLGDRQ